MSVDWSRLPTKQAKRAVVVRGIVWDAMKSGIESVRAAALAVAGDCRSRQLSLESQGAPVELIVDEVLDIAEHKARALADLREAEFIAQAEADQERRQRRREIERTRP